MLRGITQHLLTSIFFLQRINDLNEKDRARKEKEIAQNNLETFILDIQDKLSQEEFQSLVTEEDRTKILEKCSEVCIFALNVSYSAISKFLTE